MYEHTWESVRTHEVPEWFRDAKLGIFIHWGLYSVPAWAPRVPDSAQVMREQGAGGMFRANPYAEWYMNSARVEGNPTWRHHRETYGPDWDYRAFAVEFDRVTAGADLDALAGTLRAAGAEYVVLTTKHHDGYTLWPTAVPHSRHESHQAGRDLVGDLTNAVRGAGMRMGLYYSGGYDWSVNDAVMRRGSDAILAIPRGDYPAYAAAHVRELVERYRPSVLWNDIGWPGGGDLAALLADYYNAVDDGVINDRWTESPARFPWWLRPALRLSDGLARRFWTHMPEQFKQLDFSGAKHADFVTPEYRSFDEIQDAPWEQTRGIGNSFAYNQNEDPADLLPVPELVRGLADTVSKNGNLLLGVGPRADGTIPEEQLAVLAGLGDWMRVHGEAIIGTRPWRRAAATTPEGVEVRFTTRGGDLYALLVSTPTSRRLTLPVAVAPSGATLLGAGEVEARADGDELELELPATLPVTPVHVIRLAGAAS
ncbi:MAG: alpha-L-fucosidase [Microbacteriaceae bacterium]|nr:alpha-L-fucosidase [Microbacteriaceae bacterium]